MPVLLRSSVAVYVHVYNMMLTIYTQIRGRRAQSIRSTSKYILVNQPPPLYVLWCAI